MEEGEHGHEHDKAQTDSKRLLTFVARDEHPRSAYLLRPRMKKEAC